MCPKKDGTSRPSTRSVGLERGLPNCPAMRPTLTTGSEPAHVSTADIWSRIFSFSRIVGADQSRNDSAQSPAWSRNARPSDTRARAPRSARASPAKTSGGSSARWLPTDSSLARSGQSGWCSAGWSRHDERLHAWGVAAMRSSLDGGTSGIIAAMRIFSGIQPTGAKHFGNWSGGFRQYAATQEQNDAFFCIVDLHSITTAFEPRDLHEASIDLAAILFATGLDPDRSTVFAQSHVPAHAEAAWLLSSVTSYGQLGRMTQFKEKGERQEFVTAGLFTYPILMAGDILLYQTDVVPIGDDQRQHLELARDVAQRFNTRFGETFVLPNGQYPEAGARIMDLQEPERKMSTTGGTPQGTVLIVDPPDVVRKKFKTAVTDSGREVRYDPAEKAGISNLIEIMSVATGESFQAIESRYDGSGYGQFKVDVGDAVVALLEPIQARYNELRADEGELRRLLARGAEKAREASAPTLEQMYERMGFVRP